MTKRWLLALTLLLVACHKPTPHATATDRYEAERIRTLTHDEDLAPKKRSLDLSEIRLPSGYAEGSATGSSR